MQNRVPPRWNLEAPKKWGIAIALVFLSAPAVAGQAPPDEGCKSDDSAKIVRIDDRNERVFLIARPDEINTVAKVRKLLLPLQSSLRRCRPSWGKEWAVSFFSDPKYAGYKSDYDLQPFVRNGSWSKAYLAEYERQTQRLIMHPADRPRIRFLKVTLP